MPIEGFILLHPRGHYALYQAKLCHELHTGDRLVVDTGQTWIEMEVARNFEGYYLRGDKIFFYPKQVYARLIEAKGERRKAKGERRKAKGERYEV